MRANKLIAERLRRKAGDGRRQKGGPRSVRIAIKGGPSRARTWTPRLDPVGEVAVGGSAGKPARGGGAVGGLVRPRVVAAAAGPLGGVGVSSGPAAGRALHPLAAAGVGPRGSAAAAAATGAQLPLLGTLQVRVRVLLLCATRPVGRIQHHVVARRLWAGIQRDVTSRCGWSGDKARLLLSGSS